MIRTDTTYYGIRKTIDANQAAFQVLDRPAKYPSDDLPFSAHIANELAPRSVLRITTRLTLMLLILAAATTALFSGFAAAEDPLVELNNEHIEALAAASISTHTSTIDGGALNGASGLIAINLTAGDGNVQQNSTAAAHSQGISSAAVEARQYTNMVTSDTGQSLSVGINDNTFNDARGIIQINQSAGAGNAQFNGAAIAVGATGAFAYVELNDEQLMNQPVAMSSTAADPAQPNQQINVNLSPGAFKNASGLVQLNQAAGNNNSTANSFTMSVSP
ncbi:MAG: hypothetical protein KBT63_08455 [Porticoccaceae bacterium]|nr:hypothetical protein [Porticoccaceae bacterium]